MNGDAWPGPILHALVRSPNWPVSRPVPLRRACRRRRDSPARQIYADIHWVKEWRMLLMASRRSATLPLPRTAKVYVMAGLLVSVVAAPADAQMIPTVNNIGDQILSRMALEQASEGKVHTNAPYALGRGDPSGGSSSGHTNQSEPLAHSGQSIIDQTADAAMSALVSEYVRRKATFGPENARVWANQAATNLGHQLGSLAPEYKRRVQQQGQASADAWYLRTARRYGERYAQNFR